MKKDTIKVNCCGFGRITIPGRGTLVHYNSRRRRYQLFGGVYMYAKNQWGVLQALGAKRPTPGKKRHRDRRDLRLFLPRSSLEGFEKWYDKERGRETTPYRELMEELVSEEKILTDPHCRHIELHKLGFVSHHDTMQRPDCYYAWDFFQVTFTLPAAKDYLLEALVGHSNTCLVSRREIEAGKADNGRKIGRSVGHAIRFPSI